MKKIFEKKRVKCFILLIPVLVVMSCSKIDDFGNINQNPGTATTPVTSALLTNVLSALGNDTWDAATGTGLTTTSGLYCQYFSETLYTEASTYARANINWDDYYAGRLYDLQTIINYNSDPATGVKAEENGSNNNQIAVARILKVYLFDLLTDSYGDLPYSSALKGDKGIVAYDSQESIYHSFFKELSDAVAQFDDGLPPTGDILFNGDLHMWKKFANSLHAIIALRLSNIDATLGSTEFKAALSSPEGVFQSGENAQLIYPGYNYFNPIHLYYGISQQFRLAASKTITDWLINNNDNRIRAYGTSTIGFPYGVTRDSAIEFYNSNPTWARILSGEATSASAPFPVLTAAEVYLARSEAAKRGWTTENASALLESGIKESWQYWGVYDVTSFASYIQQADINLTSEPLKEICEQEWATIYPNGPRGWDIWRRTGYPDLTPAPGSTSHQIPRRFPYGGNEYSTNPENVNKAAAQYTVNGYKDSPYGRIWWDK